MKKHGWVVSAMTLCVLAVFCAPVVRAQPVTGPSRAERACARLGDAWAAMSQAPPLMAGNTGRSYRQLYDECDARNVFAGLALPTHAGRPLRCSTDPNHLAFLSAWPDGTIAFSAKMGVDADGSPLSGGTGWPNNVETWLSFDRGSQTSFANAEEVPYIAVPLPTPNGAVSFLRDTGVHKGDLAVVTQGGRCSFGVVGDAGPWFRIGEASMRVHQDLGHPQCADPAQHPCRRLKGAGGDSLPAGVGYVIFPGTRPKPLLSQTVRAVAEAEGAARLEQFLDGLHR